MAKFRISMGAFKVLLKQQTPETIRFVILGAPMQEVHGKMHPLENAYAQLCMQEKSNGNITCALVMSEEECKEIIREFYNKKIDDGIHPGMQTVTYTPEVSPMEEYAHNFISNLKVPDFIKTKPKPKKRSWIRRIFNIKEE